MTGEGRGRGERVVDGASTTAEPSQAGEITDSWPTGSRVFFGSAGPETSACRAGDGDAHLHHVLNLKRGARSDNARGGSLREIGAGYVSAEFRAILSTTVHFNAMGEISEPCRPARGT